MAERIEEQVDPDVEVQRRSPIRIVRITPPFLKRIEEQQSISFLNKQVRSLKTDDMRIGMEEDKPSEPPVPNFLNNNLARMAFIVDPESTDSRSDFVEGNTVFDERESYIVISD